MEEPHRRDEGTQPPTSSRWWGFPGVDPAQERTPTGYICPTLQRGAWDRSMARGCCVILARKDQSHGSCGRTSPKRRSEKFAWPRSNAYGRPWPSLAVLGYYLTFPDCLVKSIGGRIRWAWGFLADGPGVRSRPGSKRAPV